MRNGVVIVCWIITKYLPLHADQLFEERARNVIWTYREGIDDYERLEGISTEFLTGMQNSHHTR